MSEKDFAIGTVAAPMMGSAISKKPCYLITLEDSTGKTKVVVRFIAVEQPIHNLGFIQVKGIFTDSSEEEVISGFGVILTSTPRERQVEIMFPWHRVSSIRSLVFNAVKPVMINR
jgi:hypothetical protein